MPEETPRDRALGWGVASLLVASHFASFDVVTQPIVTDVRYFLYYAWQVAEGAVPHLDFFENKPQLSVFLSALWLRIGEIASLELLQAIRVGQLGMAAGTALLVFAVFRRLGGAAAGLGALAAMLAFGLHGSLPAVGTLPKLAMMALAAASALLAHDRRWLWAGLCGGLAFFDWQIGGAAWLGVAIAAGLFGETPAARRSALGRVCLGGVLACLPFAAFYAWHGALRAAFEQVIVATFARGTSALAVRGAGDRWDRFAELVRDACPEHAWLLLVSALGLAVAVGIGFAARHSPPGSIERDRLRLLLPLFVFHAALLAMSFVEVQGYGDLFVLLHSAAFLLGLVAWAVIEGARRLGGPERPWAAFLVAAALIVVARPGPLRAPLELHTPTIAAGGTLADQQEVAAQVAMSLGDRSIGVFDSSELLFLMGRRNAFPSLYWNRATRAYFAEPGDATPTDTVLRLIDEAAPAFFVAPRRVGDPGRVVAGSREHVHRSRSGRYVMTLRER